MSKSGKEIIAILKKKGWKTKSTRGSHVKLKKGVKTLIIPVHGNRSLGIGLLKAIEKQSGEKFND